MRPGSDAALITLCILVGVVCVIIGSGGCYNARLGYQAARAEVAAAEIRAAADRIGVAVCTLELPAEDETGQEIAGALARISTLAEDEVKLARLLQLYHGTPPALKVGLRDGNDNVEVAALAGDAMRRANPWWRRTGKWLRERLEDGMRFAAGFGASSMRTVAVAFVPWWVWVIVAVVGAACLGMWLYSLWQKWVVIPGLQREKETKERALLEAFEGIEMLPKKIRHWVGKGRPYLSMEQAPWNRRKKDESRAFEAALLGGGISGPVDDPGLARISEENARLREEKVEAAEREKVLAQIAAVLDGAPRDPPSSSPTQT